MISYSDTITQRRRLSLMTSGLAVFALVLFGRLFYLQVWAHGHYSAQASNEHTRKYEIQPKRGELYLHDGSGTVTPIALNQTLQQLTADPSFVVDKATTAKKLAAITGASATDYQTKLEHGMEYAKLDDRISTDQASKIKALNLPGISLADHDYRTYPEGSLAAQALGFVNADGAGQYGIEGYLNNDLTGTPGRLAAKTDTHGIPIATANNVIKPPVDGKSYVLTIDRNIQAMVEQELEQQVKAVKAKSGSVIIMDPSNGAIRAMANYPTFDPNQYGSTSDYSVFSNATVASEFEPGSGMKAFTMAAGLDQGKVTPDTTYTDPGCENIDGTTICNAEKPGHGPNTSMTVVLRDSLNTGVMQVLKLLGGNPDKITSAGKKTLYDYFTKHFGFGTRTGIEQAGEAAGSINPPSSNNVNYANMTFGQGISVTMVQMVSAMAALANGGKVYQPHLVDGQMQPDGSITSQAPKVLQDHVVSAQAANYLNQMLQVVVQHGSGYLAGAANPGYKIAGKTGTAQIPRPDGHGYIDNANIGSFVGFAPADNPKFVMMVRINEPGVGGFAESTTVPVFADICKWLFKYYAIPPSS